MSFFWLYLQFIFVNIEVDDADNWSFSIDLELVCKCAMMRCVVKLNWLDISAWFLSSIAQYLQ